MPACLDLPLNSAEDQWIVHTSLPKDNFIQSERPGGPRILSFVCVVTLWKVFWCWRPWLSLVELLIALVKIFHTGFIFSNQLMLQLELVWPLFLSSHNPTWLKHHQAEVFCFLMLVFHFQDNHQDFEKLFIQILSTICRPLPWKLWSSLCCTCPRTETTWLCELDRISWRSPWMFSISAFIDSSFPTPGIHPQATSGVSGKHYYD